MLEMSERVGDSDPHLVGVSGIKRVLGKFTSRDQSEAQISFRFFLKTCLLHLFTDLNIPEPVLLNNLLVVVKLLIAQYWKSKLVTSIKEWRIKCQYLLLMNKLTAIKRMNNGSENA